MKTVIDNNQRVFLISRVFQPAIISDIMYLESLKTKAIQAYFII